MQIRLSTRALFRDSMPAKSSESFLLDSVQRDRVYETRFVRINLIINFAIIKRTLPFFATVVLEASHLYYRSVGLYSRESS